MVSEATLEIVARLFYAQHDTRTPMLAYLLWLVMNTIAAYALVGLLGIVGLALASTLAFTLLASVLFILNRRRLGDLPGSIAGNYCRPRVGGGHRYGSDNLGGREAHRQQRCLSRSRRRGRPCNVSRD